MFMPVFLAQPSCEKKFNRLFKGDERLKPKAASIAILGAYPPPTGGVSVHIQRLCRQLDARGVNHVVYNLISNSGNGDNVISVFRWRYFWMLKFAFTAREPVIYLLTSRISTWLFGLFMVKVRKKRVIVRLRNSKLSDCCDRSWWHRWWIKFILSNMSAIVCVSRFLADYSEKIGIDKKKIIYAPGFVPPDVSEYENQNVSSKVWQFAKSHTPLIAANGKVEWYEDQDLYGLDHLVELAFRLKRDYPKIGIVVCFSEFLTEDARYLNQLIQLAEEKGVTHDIFFNTVDGAFIPVLAAADLFVRPTNTDGDANSVREALYLGVPTIASDVVERPDGTVLFSTRKINDFENKVRQVLDNDCYHKSQGKAASSPDWCRHVHNYISFIESAARIQT